MDKVRKLRAKRQVNDALNQRNRPSTTSIKDLPLNSSVMVQREVLGNNKTRKWTGPYALLRIDRETYIVELLSSPTNFRTIVIKPYFIELDVKEPQNIELQDEPQNQDKQQNHDKPQNQLVREPQLIRHGRGRPRKHPLPTTNFADLNIFVTQTTTKQFEYSRQKEINGLINREVFQLVPPSNVLDGIRIFNSRFVDEVKNEGTSTAFEKSRLVIQAYNDDEKSLILT